MKPGAAPGGPLARTLPGRFYHDPAIWRLEQERLFGRLWVAVGRADQFDRVNRQDWEVCEWVQAGVRSRAFAADGVYVPIERHIRGFNDFVLAELGLAADDAGPA